MPATPWAALLCSSGRIRSRGVFSFSNSNLHPASRTRPRLLRCYSSSPTSAEHHESRSPTPSPSPPPSTVVEDIYRGPFARTYRHLKLFSLSSLGLSCAFTPLLLTLDSPLPTAARLALAGTALFASSASTALIAWCGRPYVLTLRNLDDGTGGLEMTTMTMLLKPRITRVYDRDFLVSATRPFATWMLAESIVLPPDRISGTVAHSETVAETFDHHGEVLGRWIVKWDDTGKGVCYGVGKIVRHFNVHTELLQV